MIDKYDLMLLEKEYAVAMSMEDLKVPENIELYVRALEQRVKQLTEKLASTEKEASEYLNKYDAALSILWRVHRDFEQLIPNQD